VNIKIKQNDTKGKFTDVLLLDGSAVDLTGAAVSFLMKNADLAIKRTAVIASPSTGAVEYQPIAADVAVAGVFRQEWEVIFPGGQILTFPNDSYNSVTILRDLG
jgi:hypothetical protein